jgi:zinc protease
MSFRRFRLSSLAAVAVFVAAAPFTSAQTPTGRETTAESVARYALSDKMPVDPEVLVGALPNGLRYYVRANGKPSRQAELRLVVKAGSVLEDDDQQGVAHFVEHLEFEGTRNFPGQGIIQFLASLGLGIGPDANAETSYNDTQYTLRVPTDAPGVLDRALLVLEDWANAATFDQDAIDRERGIVLSEWRMHLGAQERTQDKILRAQLEGSRYTDRVPIGRPDILERVTREQLVRFYRDWYRPDLMAVIVVGDVDRNAVAQLIRSHFAGLSLPSPVRPRPTFDVPEHNGTRYAVVTDKETTATTIELSDLRPARNQGTVGGYRDIMKDLLFADMLGDRLDELTQTANAPFLRAAADRGLFPIARTRDEARLASLVANDGAARGLEALVTELERVAQFGFTESELARAKQSMMLGSERIVTESPDRLSSSRADEYTRNFLEDEALPTIWQELAFHRRLVPGITLAEINALTKDWFPDANRLIVVSAPEGTGLRLPDQAQLESVVKSASAKRLERYVDSAGGQALMDAPPRRGTVVKTTVRSDTGITEWTLSNGATVVLKPTTLREDQILFRAAAPGGTSLANDADFVPARVADLVIPAGGVGRFTNAALDKILNGKAVEVRPFIDEIDQGMRGGSTPQDLEAMMQLLYLRFTAPRADPAAFAAMAAQARTLLANQAVSPDVAFEQTIDSTLSSNHLRRRPETPATVDQWNLDKSLAFYKARFANAGNFTFTFVGSFTLDAMRPLVETYLASLPATGARESFRDLGITPPTGVIEKTVEKGVAPKSEIAIVITGPFEYDDPHKLALHTVTMLLESRLFDTIRQELGETYSITATPDMQKFPKPQYSLRIEWTCDPARTDAVVKRVFDEIAFVRDARVSPGQVAAIRGILRREFEKNSESNGYFLNQIARRYEDGEQATVASVDKMNDQIDGLSADAIQRAAATYLNLGNYVKVTRVPERR